MHYLIQLLSSLNTNFTVIVGVMLSLCCHYVVKLDITTHTNDQLVTVSL